MKIVSQECRELGLSFLQQLVIIFKLQKERKVTLLAHEEWLCAIGSHLQNLS